MVGIGISLLMNLRFGIKTKYYGLALLSSLVGTVVAIFQICLHICPNSSPAGMPVFGHSLYVWALMIFAFSMFSIAILLILWNRWPTKQANLTWNGWGWVATLYLALILCLCIVTGL